MKTLILIFGVMVLVWASTGKAGVLEVLPGVPSDSDFKTVDHTGVRCSRSLTYDELTNPSSQFLTASEKAALNSGAILLKELPQSNGYSMFYMLALAQYDPEFVMALFSSVNEHAGKHGLGDFIKASHIVQGTSPLENPFRAYYKQAVQFFDDGEYVFEDRLVSTNQREGTAFRMESKLLYSTDTQFSPRWADAYFSVSPLGSGSFISSCNYMVPRTSMFKSKFNDISRERMEKSGKNLMNWAQRVYDDNAAVEAKRDRLRRLLTAPRG